MFKFFKKKEVNEPKEKVISVHEKELTEEELETVNNFGNEEYKQNLGEEKDLDELTE